jgi:hypothetical protein
MPYTNGIFHIDYVSGSDTARTALTGCVASNPSGTITRINKTAHGLVTGAVVDTTLFTPWLNGAWKVTVVDADNFDLDDAVWQATADPNGTVTPRGGSSWSDAWKTVNTGATTARIQPGDEIRIAQTEEVSTGVTGTFTNGSRDVTLSSALTKNIELATTATNWTVSTNITRGTSTTRKIGSTSVTFSIASAFTTGKVAYATIAGGGTQDFSAYQKICLYFWPNSASSLAADTYKICLCSDATGDTIVDELNLPALINVSTPQVALLNKGSALGSNIQSVAIYANVDPSTIPIAINNIFACNDFHLGSIFGPDGDCIYAVQSINETTVAIDSASNGTTGMGYGGTTGTYDVNRISPIAFRTNSTAITFNEAGSAEARTVYVGGYNTSTNTRTGRTFFSNDLVAGTPYTINAYNDLKYLGFAQFNNWASARAQSCNYYNCVWSGNGSSNYTPFGGYFENCIFSNSGVNGIGITNTANDSQSTFYNCIIQNNTSVPSINAIFSFIKCTFRNNAIASLAHNGPSLSLYQSVPILKSCKLEDTTEVSIGSAAISILWSYRHDDTDNNHWGFTNGGTINWQTTEKQGSDPGAWRVAHTSATRTENEAIRFPFAQIAVTASSLVTVKAWVKKEHATNVGCKIRVEDAIYNLPGVSAATATAANNTSWQELTITFTPTASGIVPIWFDSFYINGNTNTYLGSITVTQ